MNRKAEMTIEEFIEARLAEDEQAALAASIEYDGESWTAAGDSVNTITKSNIAGTVEKTYNADVADHIARHDPARVLRQCAAIREALDSIWTLTSIAANSEVIWGADAELARDALASIWSEHPDYRQEWSA